ncbi:MAG TPA: AAA family ATPase [Steroidobacteraceae bacterium]|jgi:type II secretory pathway predicted ATPase ExeA|nr:AAA family ATPase [Steroidobacteraceae bacterium]
MYEQFFGFRIKPFAMNPDPAFLYPSSQHEIAAAMLEYAIEAQAAFCMLTGDIGSGKTTLLRHFLRKLGDDVSVGLISNTHEQFRSIHPWVLSSLGIAPGAYSDVQQYEVLVDYFIREYAKGRRTLLVVDEAHNLAPTILEELRLLSNVNSEQDIALQVLLVGQPELRQKLQRPELEQFAQRVTIDFHLGPLEVADAHAYVRHRLGVAGGSPMIFQPKAIDIVHARARGVPRLINQLCDMALVYAFAEGSQTVSAKMIRLVVQDRASRSGESTPFTRRSKRFLARPRAD